MRHVRLIALVLTAVTGGAVVASQAEAQYPYGGGCGFYLNRNGYSDMALPYFAQFPPVYYSHPVPRPYGWSPYAYPPTVLTPHFEHVEPADVHNPYVDPPQAEELPAAPEPETTILPERSARRPLMIINPYVAQEDLVEISAESGS